MAEQEQQPAVKTPWRTYSKRELRRKSDDIETMSEGRQTLKGIADRYWGRVKPKPKPAPKRTGGASVAKRRTTKPRQEEGETDAAALLLLGAGALLAWWLLNRQGTPPVPPPPNGDGDGNGDGSIPPGQIVLPNGATFSSITATMGHGTEPIEYYTDPRWPSRVMRAQITFLYSGPAMTLRVGFRADGTTCDRAPTYSLPQTDIPNFRTIYLFADCYRVGAQMNMCYPVVISLTEAIHGQHIVDTVAGYWCPR